jgi:putative membrane-bound dehydrogenase-like protein
MRPTSATLAFLAINSLVHAQQPDDLARELPRIKPLASDAALKSFRLHDGFRLVPVATEPLVTNPVAVAYDADGKAYVVEMRGYPYTEDKPSGGVALLVDVDGDGVFDRRTTFVDGLSWPTGVVPFDGGVFIAVAPHILYAKDTDGDGVADIKRTVFTGFGTENVQGLLNGLLWGVDGWIYGSASSNGGLIRNLTRPNDPPVSVRGRDFRFKPDGSAFEAISGGGQFGHALDDWGHRFVCSNSNHIRQVILPAEELARNPAYLPAAVTADVAVEGGAAPVFRISPAEPWRVVRTRQRNADPAFAGRLAATERFAIGFFTSATGVTIYRGSAFPPEYRGNAFIGDVGGNLVHRKLLTRNGPTVRATRADKDVEFLASTDNWFRPVNFANTPSGTLLVVDMYRETIEHPASIPEPIKKHLDLTSGRDRGRLYEIVPDGFERRPLPKLSTAKTNELCLVLADPDGWWRETAQRLLIERRDPEAVGMLTRIIKDRPNALGRVHVLWTLDALNALDASVILDAIGDADPNVREVAAGLAERRLAGHPDLEAALVRLADDPDPAVRFRTAFALGAARGRAVLPALAAIARPDGDDRWTRAAILSSVAGRADGLLTALISSKGEANDLATPAGRAWLDDLALLVGAENASGRVAGLLGQFLRSGVDPRLSRAVLLGVARGLKRSGSMLRDANVDPDLIRPYFDEAERTARGRGPIRDRLDAIGLVAVGAEDRAVAILPELLDAREPSAVQLAALQALTAPANPRVGPAIVGQWKALSPGVRREAVEALFARQDRLNALLDGLESKQIVPTDLDPTRQALLLKHPDAMLRDRARRLLGNVSRADRTTVLAAFKPALTLDAKPDHGRVVFKAACATCHVARDLGVDVGPNLATVANRTPEDLLVHILDPNREVASNYVNYAVSTVDGRVVTGLIAEETANSITLKRAEGARDVIPRDRIEAVASSGQSLMPEGLEKSLSAQDFADLIAFLRQVPVTGSGR